MHGSLSTLTHDPLPFQEMSCFAAINRLFSLQNDISIRFNARHIITALQKTENMPETETVHVLSTLLERYKITAEVIRVKLIEFCHCVYEFVRVQCTYRYVSYDFGLDVKVHAAHLTLKLLVMGHSSDRPLGRGPLFIIIITHCLLRYAVSQLYKAYIFLPESFCGTF